MQCVFVVIDGASPHPCIAIVIVGCRQGLWLAAMHCHHWGYMGAATHVGGAPHPCVVIGGTWGCGLQYPCRCIGHGALCHALVEGPLYHPIVVVGIACGLQLTLVERVLAAAVTLPLNVSLDLGFRNGACNDL